MYPNLYDLDLVQSCILCAKKKAMHNLFKKTIEYNWRRPSWTSHNTWEINVTGEKKDKKDKEKGKKLDKSWWEFHQNWLTIKHV